MVSSHRIERQSGWDYQRTTTVGIDRGRQIAYAEYGAPDGVPVVFRHGTPGSRRLGELLGPVARGNGVRVLADADHLQTLVRRLPDVLEVYQ